MAFKRVERSLNLVLNRIVLRVAQGATIMYALLFILQFTGLFQSTAGRVRSTINSAIPVLLLSGVALLMRRWRTRPGAYEIGWMAMMISFGLIPILRIGADQEPLRLASNLVVLPMAGIFIQRRVHAFVAIGFVLCSALAGPFLLPVSSRSLTYYAVLLVLSLVASIYLHLMMRMMFRRVTSLLQRLWMARGEIHELAGFLPICAWCKSVRDDEGYWQQVEAYLAKKSKLSFTHGMCPVCRRKVEAEFESEFQQRSGPTA